MISAYRIGGKSLVGKNPADVKIDVGPASRWSELASQETLDNLLSAGYISFAHWAELSPDNSGLPKERLIAIAKEREAAVSDKAGGKPTVNVEAEAEKSLKAEKSGEVDSEKLDEVKALLKELSEEERKAVEKYLPESFIREVEKIEERKA